jgi:rhodanese-related sulfurtransferase
VKAVTEGLDEPPQYFAINARFNKEGYESLDKVLKQGMIPLSVDDFKTKMKEEDMIVLDTRNEDDFAAGFIPGAIFIGLEGRFAEWAGSLLSFNKPMILVAEPEKEEEAIIRLARVGFDKVYGYLDGGFQSWKKAGEPIDMIIGIEPDELAMDIPFDEKLVVLDVRRPSEYAEGHIKDAVNLPLGEMKDPGSMANLNDDENLYVHCASGYRSMIAASLLKREGFNNLRNVIGGWSRIREEEKIETEKEKAVLN